ncbi:DUF2059 domain-containing protein [Pseudomonas lopnurensis]|uniref:DUF2059 domain-containing protein n=1 Tax=Pseudomonas lopnurensis TaxID=1477517 RepID=UPI00187B0E07|nr:DUF2059 domain-containing protein [Pseudomonas lopnurensis]MBE7373868.1 DUF2059 domain-containing protein [Pseudomonas lopnurensis]
MKNSLLLCCILILTINLTYAASQEKKQAAEDFLIAMDAATLTEQSIDQVLAMELQQNPKLLPYRDAMREFYARHIGYEPMKADMIRIYTEHFSIEELNSLADFYRTPVGKKSIRLTPEIMAKSAEAGRSKIMANLHELQELINLE